MGPSPYVYAACTALSHQQKAILLCPFTDEGAGSDGLRNSLSVTVGCGCGAELIQPVN